MKPIGSGCSSAIAMYSISLMFLVSARAEAIDTHAFPPRWDEISKLADFVGVVVCVKSGQPVSEYVVTRSSKGVAAGSHLLLQRDSYVFPFVVGDEVVVVAQLVEHRAVDLLHDATPLGARLKRPYYAELWSRPVEKDATYLLPGQRFNHFDDFWKGLLQFLALPTERRDVLTIFWQFRRVTGICDESKQDICGSSYIDRPELTRAIVLSDIYGCLKEQSCCTNTGAAAIGLLRELLIDFHMTDFPSRIAQDAGGFADAETYLKLKHSFEGYVAPSSLTAAQLRGEAKKAIKMIERGGGLKMPSMEVFVYLLARRPGIIEKYLRQVPYSYTPELVTYISYLGSTCRHDCVAVLNRLKRSTSSVVRVGAAIYRLIRGDSTAVAELRHEAEVPDVYGRYGKYWAAVALARRGDRDAMDIAMELLTDKDSLVVSSDLRAEVIALLSNSLQTSHLGSLSDATALGYYEALSSYRAAWMTHRSEVKLEDPWLADLVARHLD
jgi:hypothetical protein